jgi:hypothetical protein
VALVAAGHRRVAIILGILAFAGAVDEPREEVGASNDLSVRSAGFACSAIPKTAPQTIILRSRTTYAPISGRDVRLLELTQPGA